MGRATGRKICTDRQTDEYRDTSVAGHRWFIMRYARPHTYASQGEIVSIAVEFCILISSPVLNRPGVFPFVLSRFHILWNICRLPSNCIIIVRHTWWNGRETRRIARDDIFGGIAWFKRWSVQLKKARFSKLIWNNNGQILISMARHTVHCSPTIIYNGAFCPIKFCVGVSSSGRRKASIIQRD